MKKCNHIKQHEILLNIKILLWKVKLLECVFELFVYLVLMAICGHRDQQGHDSSI